MILNITNEYIIMEFQQNYNYDSGPLTAHVSALEHNRFEKKN